MTSPTKTTLNWVQQQKEAYEHGQHRPEGSFAAIMGAYGATVAGLGVLIRRSGQELPKGFSAADTALLRRDAQAFSAAGQGPGDQPPANAVHSVRGYVW